MNITEEKTELGGKYLTFALSKERYGLPILAIQEIICVPNITRVPKCPPEIKGVINLRGKIIPLLDLRLRFGLAPATYNDKTCIVIVSIRKAELNLSVGVIVDTVLEVINFTSDEIGSAPKYGTQVDSSFITGMARRAEGPLNILIDVEKVLANYGLVQLSAQ